MIQQTPEPTDKLLPEQKEELHELTTKSWNLELVISGAAIFAVLQLPPLLDEAFDYIHYNLLNQTEGMPGAFSILALSMMKASCYVLFMAFLTNFVMRAFWVGLIGLLAVFPSGIQYDRLAFANKYTRERMASELGSLETYILKLDKKCNIVFAVSFLFVFILIIWALSYLLIVFVYFVLQPLIPDHYWQGIKITLFILLAVLGLISILLYIPQISTRPGMANLQYSFFSLNKFFMWGLYKPFSYITNTFYSHIPAQQLLRMIGLMSIVFIVLISIEFINDLSQHENDLSQLERHVSFLNSRHLHTARVDSLFFNSGTYDNLRTDDMYIGQASIQADVIREPFIRLYVAYPKALDTLLTRLSHEPVWSDSLPRIEQRRLHAEWSNQRINRLVHLRINDSLYTNPEFLFTKHGEKQQQGWQTVLLPTNLKSGKNMIRIGIQADSSAKEERLATIPFWYIPER